MCVYLIFHGCFQLKRLCDKNVILLLPTLLAFFYSVRRMKVYYPNFFLNIYFGIYNSHLSKNNYINTFFNWIHKRCFTIPRKSTAQYVFTFCLTHAITYVGPIYCAYRTLVVCFNMPIFLVPTHFYLISYTSLPRACTAWRSNVVYAIVHLNSEPTRCLRVYF